MIALQPPAEPSRAGPTSAALFAAFFKIGCLGFGGVAAFARHVLVVERGFVSEVDFAETFGLASSLPGANTVNFATMLGDRFRGPGGAAAALAGLLGAPLLILVVLATLYARFSYLPDVRAALAGAAAAAAGLVFGTAVRLWRSLDAGLPALLLVGAITLAAGLVEAPMLAILAVAIPISVLLARRRLR